MVTSNLSSCIYQRHPGIYIAYCSNFVFFFVIDLHRFISTYLRMDTPELIILIKLTYARARLCCHSRICSKFSINNWKSMTVSSRNYALSSLGCRTPMGYLLWIFQKFPVTRLSFQAATFLNCSLPFSEHYHIFSSTPMTFKTRYDELEQTFILESIDNYDV